MNVHTNTSPTVDWAIHVTTATLLNTPDLTQYPTIHSFVQYVPYILDRLLEQFPKQHLLHWAQRVTLNVLRDEVFLLTEKEAGLHFLPKQATEEKLRRYSISHLARTMQTLAPTLWHITDELLQADDVLNRDRIRRATERRRKARSSQAVKPLTQDGSDPSERDTFNGDDDDDLPFVPGEEFLLEAYGQLGLGTAGEEQALPSRREILVNIVSTCGPRPSS